ncbi:MAG: tetratricopeptide repeat protein [Candidatus Omnitrophica bacterium]|nr:tetratricopeptide repeat protein [Candidatus Omnitrophota bacterium]
MYSGKVRLYLVTALVLGWVFALVYFLGSRRGVCPFRPAKQADIRRLKETGPDIALLEEALTLLVARKDNAALLIFERVLSVEPNNPQALWGKAEVLRRARRYKEAEALLNKVLQSQPHPASLISLSYIRYKEDKLDQAQRLVKQALKCATLNREDKAVAYMMLGAINSGRSGKGWFLDKLRYGTRIRGYFLKARELGPGLPEVHLGLGTFYLKAPAIAGGDLDKAFAELTQAIKIAPDFATANARLAQAYKKKGDLEKYNFYLAKAQRLDPENEVLKEINE